MSASTSAAFSPSGAPLSPRIGIVRRENKDAAAFFIPGAPALRPVVVPREEPAENGKQPPPSAAPEPLAVLDLLAAAKLAEVDRARRKLESRMALTRGEQRLLEKAYAQERKTGDKEEGADEALIVRAITDSDVWWVNGAGGTFQLRDGGHQWIEVPREDLYTMLMERGVSDERVAGSRVDQLRQAAVHVFKHRTLDAALDGLAGFGSGIQEFHGKRVLLRKGPQLTQPKEGDWSTIEALLMGLLLLDDAPTPAAARVQYERFLYWMKRATENVQMQRDEWLCSQVMILAGPAGCGKSLIQHEIITPLLGYRKADPSRYLFGDSTFNEGWMATEHLLIEDPRPKTKLHDRLMFAQMLKSLAVNRDHMLHPKGKSEFGVPARYTVSISINDDPDALRVLPKLSPDVTEKLMLFRLRHHPLPMPSETAEEQSAFRQRLGAEIPAFLHFLLEMQVPEHLKDPHKRFGVAHYVNPELALEMGDDTPEAEFLALIDRAVIKGETSTDVDFVLWQSPSSHDPADYLEEHPRLSAPLPRLLLTESARQRKRVWIGSALELGELMDRSTNGRAWKKISDHNAIHRLLGRLAQDRPDRVCDYRVSRPVPVRLWIIGAPYPEAEQTGSDDDANRDVGF